MSTKTKRGRDLIGQPVYVQTNGTRSTNFSIIAAATKEGMLVYKNNIYYVNDFCVFLRDLRQLCTLKNIHSPIFIMDNARIHHFSKVLALKEELNLNILFLPPYFPSLNFLKIVF
jgi:transposase